MDGRQIMGGWMDGGQMDEWMVRWIVDGWIGDDG